MYVCGASSPHANSSCLHAVPFMFLLLQQVVLAQNTRLLTSFRPPVLLKAHGRTLFPSANTTCSTHVPPPPHTHTHLAQRAIFVFALFSARHARRYARSPQSLLSGMNRFLSLLNVTFRRDPTNYRPRINKLNSQKDAEQKASGNYFFLESDD